MDARNPETMKDITLDNLADRPENSINRPIWVFRLISDISTPQKKDPKIFETQMESLSFPWVTTQTDLKILKIANYGI